MKRQLEPTAIIVNFGDWLRRLGADDRLMPTHVSLFTALFICWQRSGYANPFNVTRKSLMGYAKIASIATYHKCIRELDRYGYIRYRPSYHPTEGSRIYWPFLADP